MYTEYDFSSPKFIILRKHITKGSNNLQDTLLQFEKMYDTDQYESEMWFL